MMSSVFVFVFLGAVHWEHPAGFITDETIGEIRQKAEGQEWARGLLEGRRSVLGAWVDLPYARIQSVFPVKRGNVYHNFSCPDCRLRLKIDLLESRRFYCSACGKDYAPDVDAGIYPKGDRYHGTLYDGWACLFYQTVSDYAVDLALIGRMEGREAWKQRARELLLLFADTIKGLPTVQRGEGDDACILTYKREGDNVILNRLAQAYELLRDGMPPDERVRVERDVLGRMLDDIMLEPIYTFDHNNIYQWHRTVLQTGLALEREDLIDWSFGYGEFTAEKQPEHRSLRRVAARHFNADGAFWELCSGYHLYPMDAFCQLAVLTRNISRMDSERFPGSQYDFTDPANPVGAVIKAALEWYVSMAMPDRSMTIVGDSPVSRSGMDSYSATAEVGYRYFDVRAVGDYATLRQGQRSWMGLLLGAPQIVQQATPFRSSYLSSGWVSLRSETPENRVWAGLNALIPGGGHQHSDRLTLTLFSQGKLLALEKGTPYNEQATRELGTQSPSHNTVTVDQTSQKRGSTLKGAEIPQVELFFDAPFVKFAQAGADHLYPQTQAYRRAVALIEDVVVDVFFVQGGTTHDWMIHHAGTGPVLSMPAESATFEPAEWLTNGTDRVRCGTGEGDWTAQWTVDDVTSRLWMAGCKETRVYALETYPIDNAVITPQFPPCSTLCVRRGGDGAFVAVWDAWKTQANLRSVSEVAGSSALILKTAGAAYDILYGPGSVVFPDGLTMTSDASFCVLKDGKALACLGGTYVEVTQPQGGVRLRLSERANAWADWGHGECRSAAALGIEYDTVAGRDRPRDATGIQIWLDGPGLGSKD